ncbi:metallophosphoesterase family protein [Coprobacter tertius]|uniref:Metallophosphoesterase n=1 Tax=Coprobacter tertius TaxID=2944915 RepID=A0ABT1MIL0_9BACT|nr:metallophosphoesterase [Coprobacter tertius]MCP9611076.1 metallophosphoesterase [Coprobacter tertius]
MKHTTLSTLIFFLFTACDVFEYHPYDVKLGKEYRHINATQIAALKEKNTGKGTLRFAFMGDTQRFYDETEDFVAHINGRNDIDFVIHGGDMSDFGLKKEFIWCEDRMKKLKVPYITLCGNHDILGTGEEIYTSMYGDLNFSFIFERVKFICINTNALEFDYSTPVPDFDFILREIRQSDEYDKTVFVMHVPPGDIEFNNNVKFTFQQQIKQAQNLLFCMHAHTHTFKVTDYFNDGLLYYACDTIMKRSYLLFTITPEGYSYEYIHF